MAKSDKSSLVVDVPRETISERLRSATETLQADDYPTKYATHRYPSGHVEGQLTIEIPRGISPTQAALDLEQALGKKRMAGFWFNAGVLYHMESVEGADYRRSRGSYNIDTHPQKATPHNLGEIMLIVRNRIAGKSSQTLRRKPTAFYIRFYWSPDGSRPSRKGHRK